MRNRRCETRGTRYQKRVIATCKCIATGQPREATLQTEKIDGLDENGLHPVHLDRSRSHGSANGRWSQSNISPMSAGDPVLLLLGATLAWLAAYLWA